MLGLMTAVGVFFAVVLVVVVLLRATELVGDVGVVDVIPCGAWANTAVPGPAQTQKRTEKRAGKKVGRRFIQQW
jgi:hypothetical protein